MLLRNLAISRPRFWLYLLGPFLIGAVAGGGPISVWLVLLAIYFTYPANFIIYGVNDVYDYETDKLNPKKQGYEALVEPRQAKRILYEIVLWVGLGYLLLELTPGQHEAAQWGLLGFLVFGLLYSMPPVRAKARPLLDSIFNVLYVFPAMVGYGVTSEDFPDWRLFAAATIWCMAMHAYSAIPDIAADTQAKLRTIATWLGARGTLLFCMGCYLVSGFLAWPALGWFGVAISAVYLLIMILTLANPQREHVFKLYKFFPYINMLVGMALFFFVLLGRID